MACRLPPYNASPANCAGEHATFRALSVAQRRLASSMERTGPTTSW